MTQSLLVVDDEPQFLRTLSTNLRGAGYAVETAETVKAALSAAKAGHFDAVVLDLILPDGNGTDVCAGLRAWSDVPIVVVSAVGEEQEKVDALDAGADDYVVKPFPLAELLARLRAVLRRAAPSSEALLVVTAALTASSVPFMPADVTRTAVAWGKFQSKWPGVSEPSCRLAVSKAAVVPVTFTIAVDVAGTVKLN